MVSKASARKELISPEKKTSDPQNTNPEKITDQMEKSRELNQHQRYRPHLPDFDK